MKAIRIHEFGGPEVMKLEEVAHTEPGPGQLVVSVRAIGVNPVDTYIRSGAYAVKPPLPFTPGMDAAGVVESVGEGVSRFKPGDRVYTSRTLSGAYAQEALALESQIHPLPDRVSFEQGAALGVPYATAYRALFQRARAVASESVLVHGASGGVGIAAVQLARAAGMKVIGTAGTDEGRKLVLEHGAHKVIDHSARGYLDDLVSLTGEQGFDVILEMLANVNLANDLKLLAKFGRVVVIGSRGEIQINPRDAMGRDAAILGMTMMNATDRDLKEIHAALVSGLENGTLTPVIGKQLPLSEAPRAHKEVLEPGAYGKIVLIP